MHQADVSLLNQVYEFYPVIFIFMGDLDHKPQIRSDQFFGCLHVVMLYKPHRQLEFFFSFQDGEAVYLRHINVYRIGYCGQVHFRSFKFDGLVKSPKNVMPDLIRHPEHIEITGFRLPPE